MKNFKKFAETMFAMNLVLKGYDFSKESEDVAKRLWQIVLDTYWIEFKKYEEDLFYAAIVIGRGQRWKWFPKPVEITEMIKEVSQNKWLAAREAKERLKLLEDGQPIENIDTTILPLEIKVMLDRIITKHNMRLALKKKAAGDGQ